MIVHGIWDALNRIDEIPMEPEEGQQDEPTGINLGLFGRPSRHDLVFDDPQEREVTLHSARKPGVIVNGLLPIMEFCDNVVHYTFLGLGYASIITSALDGKHSQNSLHYEGLALDYRRRHVPDEVMRQIVRRLRKCLGGDWDIVLERTHLHIEYDPD